MVATGMRGFLVTDPLRRPFTNSLYMFTLKELPGIILNISKLFLTRIKIGRLSSMTMQNRQEIVEYVYLRVLQKYLQPVLMDTSIFRNHCLKIFSTTK